jgi:dTDP-3-amino-3,4,6-trideoxy-alpha-D-glucose transaminase
VKFCDLGLHDTATRLELERAFHQVLDRGTMIMGTELEAFEDEFSTYCGASHAIGVGNGLDALILALRAANIGPGDEVIVPSHTFAATWLAVLAVGAKIVPVEPDAASYVITDSAVAAAITSRTAAIIPVSLYGHPVAIEPLRILADRHGLFLLEDAAQAHGSDRAGIRTGSRAHATAFSFYPTKNLGALGDGGAVVTSDIALAKRIARLRNYGSIRKYEHDEAGVNSRLDELQAAFLRIRLRDLDEANARRRVHASTYDAALAGIPGVSYPSVTGDSHHVYHLYVIRVCNRDEVQRQLTKRGIPTLIHYPIACHRQPAFAALNLKPDSFPLAERLAKEVLSLPMWPQMPEGTAEDVAKAIRSIQANLTAPGSIDGNRP